MIVMFGHAKFWIRLSHASMLILDRIAIFWHANILDIYSERGPTVWLSMSNMLTPYEDIEYVDIYAWYDNVAWLDMLH